MAKDVSNITIDYDDPEFRITPFQQAAASCTGAVVTSLFVTPLDVVKIRLQAQQTVNSAFKQNKCFLYCNGLMDHLCSCNPEDPNRWYQRPGKFNGTLDAFIKITRNEGLTSLWSGLSPTLVLAIPATIVYFVTYEQLRLKLKDVYNNKNKSSDVKLQQPYWIPLISGATARIFSASLVSPIELIRTKMQSQRLSYLEIHQALQTLIKQDGIRGLWTGVFPTLLRDVPFSAVYWMHYEAIKSFYSSPDTPLSFWLSFMAGAISGCIAAFVTVPFDVVKTHQQIEFGQTAFTNGGGSRKNRATLHIMRQIYKEHGIRGLFAGTVPRVIKVAPACAIMISSFEYGKVFFNRLANQQLGKQFLVEVESSNISPHKVPTSNVGQFKDQNIISTSGSSPEVL